MRRLVIAAALLIILIAGGAGALSTAEAQVRLGWSQPFQLSNPTRSATEAALVADAYGYVHAFWAEALPDGRVLLQYARFDGQTWSLPVDIRRSRPDTPIKSPSAGLDEDGTLHLIWIEGFNGPVMYSSAPAEAALASQHWQRPTAIKAPADEAKIEVGTDGQLHLLYKVISGKAGIYYVRSADRGVNWSSPFWLDPDILAGHIPGFLQLEIDAQNGLHAAWFYVPAALTEGGTSGDMLRYSHSLDGGETWAQPFTLAKNGPGTDELGGFSRPYLTVSGSTVHVIWAAGDLLYRHHRYSLDRGLTWTSTTRIFGNLNGHAGDGFAVDGLGRVHFFAQIRFPQGIYHATWDAGQWTRPALIYLIRAGELEQEEIPEGIVHAHRTYPVVRAGNQLVLTFTDPPPEALRRLFVIERTLSDVPAATLIPIPTPAPEPSPTPPPVSPTPAAAGTASSLDAGPANVGLEPESSPARYVGIGVVLPLILLAGVVVLRAFHGQRR